MKLFADFERTRQIPMPRASTQFESLNECADPDFAYARSFVGEWFEHFPDSAAKSDVHARITSKDDDQHQTALFELYIHELLLRCGFTVVAHPPLKNGVRKRPDFLASRDNTPTLYVEATTTTESKKHSAEERVLGAICDALDKTACRNFILSATYSGEQVSMPKLGVLCRKVEEWVSGLDPSQAASGEKPTLTWEEDSWSIQFRATPISEDLHGAAGLSVVGLASRAARFIVPEEGILQSLREKADSYGALHLPFVVAINMLDRCRREVDIAKGLLRAWGGEDGRRYPNTSAALMAWLPNAIAAPRVTPILVHHPHPTYSLLVQDWPLPQYRLTKAGLIPIANPDAAAPVLLQLDR